MVEPPPSAHSRVLAAEAHGAAAITVAIAAAANNGAVMRALMVIIVNPPYCRLRRPPVGYDSRPGFGLIMKTPLGLQPVQRARAKPRFKEF